MPAPPFYGVGCTHKFRSYPMRKDGVVYNLATATVTLIVTDPSGNAASKSCTVEDAANGRASYTTLTTDFDETGEWTIQFKVVDGAVTLKGRPVTIEVGP